MRLKGWPAKTAVSLGVVIAGNSFGSVLLRAGMKHDVVRYSFQPTVLLGEFLGFLSSGDVWLGIVCRIIAGIAFLCLLSWADYSYVNPSAASGYILTVFLGWAMLGEVVPPVRWIGTLLITGGVLLVGLTPARTTPATDPGRAEAGACADDRARASRLP